MDTGRNPSTGKRHQRTKGGFATKRAAEDAMRSAISGSTRNGVTGPASPKLGAYLAEWLETIRPRLRATTFGSYKVAVERATVALGARRLDEITPLGIERFYADLAAGGGRYGRGMSAKTIRNTHIVLRKALADAERLELVSRNPASRAKAPTAHRPEIATWTSDQLRTFLSSVDDDPWRPIWVLLATTGLRRGEALGLRWRDLDLPRANLSVRQTVTTVGAEVVVCPPKTDRSRRRIALDPGTVATLEGQRQHQLDERRLCGFADPGGDDLVFAGADGSPLHPDQVTRRFKRLMRGLDLPELRGPHGLRHTWASLALAAGVHPKVVSDRLGHSTIAITIDTYSHVVPSLDVEAAITVADQIFENAENDDRAIRVR